ncbi:MAG: hypothetical protein JRF33_08970 [Deltaproteobacteria bacterium]|nr:hypothetical protein [Deltaproteobacteria bacterium]
MRSGWTRWLTLMALGLISVTCGYELDTTRNPAPRESFGSEIYKIIVKDLDRYQPAKGLAFTAEKARFVSAADGIFAEGLVNFSCDATYTCPCELQTYLSGMLSLYDSGWLQTALRPTGCMLAHELATDRPLLQALGYENRHLENCDSALSMPILQRVLAQPDAADLLREFTSLWLAHDGLDEGLEPNDEDDTFASLLADLAVTLAGAEQATPDPEGTRASFVDWLLSEDARLDEAEQMVQWIVRLDERGRPLVTPDPNTGALPAPFADLSGDGLADTDAISGVFVDAGGQTIDVPAACSGDGQLPWLNGRLAYLHRDLGLTMLAGLLDQVQPMVVDGILWQLPEALPALLGPFSPRADDEGLYSGYDPDQAALMALGHALFALADYDRLPQILEVTAHIVEVHEAKLARLLHEMDKAADLIDLYPQGLSDHNRLVDDLMPHLWEVAERGYIDDFLRSFADPRWQNLQAGLGNMIRYRFVQPANCGASNCLTSSCDCDYDSFDLNGDQADYQAMQLPTDFNLPDTVYTNRSNLQRGVHLIHDTNGVRHSVSVLGWEPFPIVDMLGFYVDSAAGDENGGLAEVAWYVQSAVTEFSSEHPPAEEVSLFMVHDHSVLGNPAGFEGLDIRNYNGEALLAFKHSGALDGFRPAYVAFASQDRNLARGGTHVLGDLMAAIHPHYSPNLPHASSACANVRPLEPMLLEIFDSTEVLDSLVDLMAALQGQQTASGYNIVDELAAFTHHLLQNDSSLRRHDGAVSVLAADGLTPVAPFNRFYLLIDALRMADDAVANDPSAEAAFEQAAELIWDRFLDIEEVGGQWRLVNRRAFIVMLNGLLFARDQVADLLNEGRLSTRLAELDADLAELLGGRILPRLVEAWQLLAEHPSLPGRIDDLTLELFDPTDLNKVREMRRLAGWALQKLCVDRVTVPMAQALARQIDPEADAWTYIPETGCLRLPATPCDESHACLPLACNTDTDCQQYSPWPGSCSAGQCVFEKAQAKQISHLMRLGQALLAMPGNEQDVVAALLSNAAQTINDGSGQFAAEALLDVIGEVHRCTPGQTGPLNDEDMTCVLQEVGDFLLDEERGVEKLYLMVDRRDGY